MQTLSFKDPKYEIKTRYSVEFLAASSDNGAQRWKLYQHANDQGSIYNPWELLDNREFDDVGTALEFYLTRLLDEQTFVVCPIFEEILVNGVTVREAYIEERQTFHLSLRNWVNKEACDELDRIRRAEKENAELLVDYAEFVKKFNGDQHFREFRDQKWKERNAYEI